MLYAGTESGVFISWDDGSHWQPLKLNLPSVPVYDLVVKNNNLVIATHGRAFWILDDLSPLRDLVSAATADVHFYKPASAFRQRGRGFQIPSQAPVGQNPPGPVVLDYFLKTASKGEVTLEILDAQAKPVRKYSSQEPKKKRQVAETESEFEEFLGPTAPKLPTKAGMNRFTWDLRYGAPDNVPGLAQWGGRPRGRWHCPEATPRASPWPANSTRFRSRSSPTHATRPPFRNGRSCQGRPCRRRRAGEEGHAGGRGDRADQVARQRRPAQLPHSCQQQAPALAADRRKRVNATPSQQSYAVFDELSKQLDSALTKWKKISGTTFRR